MTVKFDFQGGRELDAALADFARPMAKAVGRRALKIAADPILSVYKSLTKVLTGQLERSEIIGTKLTKRQARLNRGPGKSGVEVHIGTADPAGVQEEFGNVRQAARPALRPAWDAEGNERALGRIADALWADIAKTAARVARRAAKKG